MFVYTYVYHLMHITIVSHVKAPGGIFGPYCIYSCVKCKYCIPTGVKPSPETIGCIEGYKQEIDQQTLFGYSFYLAK